MSPWVYLANAVWYLGLGAGIGWLLGHRFGSMAVVAMIAGALVVVLAFVLGRRLGLVEGYATGQRHLMEVLRPSLLEKGSGKVGDVRVDHVQRGP